MKNRIKSLLLAVLLVAPSLYTADEVETVKKTHKKTILHRKKHPETERKYSKKTKTSQGKKTVTEKTTRRTPRSETSTFSEKVAQWAAPLGIGTGTVTATTGQMGTERISHKNVLTALESEKDLSLFTQALKKAGYADQLQWGHTQFTVFAPTNKAIAQIGGQTALTPALLESHIIEGKEPLRLRELEGRKRLNTMAHKQRKVEYKNRFVYVDGVQLSSQHEIVTDNGVIYRIDQVLENK